MTIPETQRTREMDAMQRLGYYPLILIAVWLAPTVNRVQNFVAPGRPLFWLYLAHALTSSLMVRWAPARGNNKHVLKESIGRLCRPKSHVSEHTYAHSFACKYTDKTLAARSGFAKARRAGLLRAKASTPGITGGWWGPLLAVKHPSTPQSKAGVRGRGCAGFVRLVHSSPKSG